MALQQMVNGAAQFADAFAMDDADFPDAPAFALGEVFEHNFLHVPRAEGMQIEHAVNGDGGGIGQAGSEWSAGADGVLEAREAVLSQALG